MQTLLLFLSACAWVSDDDIAELKPFVDDDGDGVINSEDCEPGDGTIAPTAVDTPYDGIDSNCDESNDNDVDGDGYDGIDGGGTDCNDQDSRISPGQNDPFYDGTDQNCDGADDYDADGDGFRSASHLDDAGSYGDDCFDDDTDDFVNPGDVAPGDAFPGATETWYDGTDQDCGNDDDFDQDGDDAVCAAAADVNGACDGDCNDADPLAYYGAAEIWYDNIDQDCLGGDDQDQDGDGYVLADDCDDVEEEVHPYAIEVADDGIDGDCDDGDTTVQLRGLSEEVGWTWINPQAPVFAVGGDYVLLSVATDDLTLPLGGGTASDGTAGVYWATSEVTNPAPVDPLPFAAKLLALSASPSNVLGVTVGAAHEIVVDGNLIYDVLATESGGDPSFFLSQVVTLGAITATAESVAGSGGEWNDLAVISSGGSLQLVGCSESDDTLTWVDYNYGSGVTSYLTASGYGFTACAADYRTGVLHVFGVTRGGVMGEYTVEVDVDGSLVVTLLSTDLPYVPTDLDLDPTAGTQVLAMAESPMGAVVLYESGTETLVGEGTAPQKVSLAIDDSGMRYVGFVTAGGQPWLGYETETGFLEVKHSPPGAGFIAEDVAVTIVEDTLVYAVTGRYTAGGDEVAVGQIKF